MDSESKRLEEIKIKFNESYSSLSSMMNKFMSSHDFYGGKQWSRSDAESNRKKNIPSLVFNLIKKIVDTFNGIRIKNKSALKCLPEDIEDNDLAGVGSKLLHFVMRKGRGYRSAGETFKEQNISGLGWCAVYMDFSKDPVNGDIKYKAVPPNNIFFDPATKEINLEDCNYLFYRTVIPVENAILLNPSKRKQIEDSNIDYNSDYFVNEETGLAGKCVLKEFWERVLEEHITIYAGGQYETFTHAQYNKNKDLISEMQRTYPDYEEIKTHKRTMKLTQIINDTVIVYDGPSPYKFETFPFVPFFGFYDKSVRYWEYKIQSLIDPLKDPQSEYNKWRVSQVSTMLHSIHSGWVVEQGTLHDKTQLKYGMSTPILEVNPGKIGGLKRIDPPKTPPGFFEQTNESYSDIMKIGLNAETMGLSSNVESAKGIKLKHMQGLVPVEEILDNFHEGFALLGMLTLKMIFQFYSYKKVMRILGREYAFFTKEMFDQVSQLDMDIEVDETTFNPVNKMYRLETIQLFQQYKMPGFTAEDVYDLADIDPADRRKFSERYRKEMERVEQKQQMLAQSQQQLNQAKAGSEQAKAEAMRAQAQLQGAMAAEKITEAEMRAGAMEQISGGFSEGYMG